MLSYSVAPSNHLLFSPLLSCPYFIKGKSKLLDDTEPSIAIRVYTVISAIPEGKVSTYGTIARLAGAPRNSRQVGKILQRLPKDSKLPWFRVVNSQGKISLTGPDYIRQKNALLADGVLFTKSGRVNFKLYGWLV